MSAINEANKDGQNLPRFESVSCSQCGRDFGPGDHGFSHCSSHRHLSSNSESNNAAGLVPEATNRQRLGEATAAPSPAAPREKLREGAKFPDLVARLLEGKE